MFAHSVKEAAFSKTENPVIIAQNLKQQNLLKLKKMYNLAFMKKYLTIKRIVSILAILLVVVQFIRPERNEGNANGENDITHFTSVPDDVKQILETSCYDCHSDHTNYPWYTNIQPIGLWMQHHVDEGKQHLNYSQYNTYKPKRQKHKMEETIDSFYFSEKMHQNMG